MKKLILSILILLLCIFSLSLISCNGDTAPFTTPTFKIVNTHGARASVSFEITETDPDNAGEIKSIELYQNGVKIKTAESTDVRKFSNLTQNTKYTVKVTYSYDLQNGEGEKTDSVSTDVSTTNDGFTSRTDIKKDWDGKTLNIACSTWSYEPRAPWSVIELCVEEGKESGFGTKIDAAVLERQKFIEETYGVKINWIDCGRYDFGDELNKAEIAGNVGYDLALPRALRVQSIVANGLVYDMNNRDYIDFSNPYYNKDSVETYTAKGHTFFVDGDFSIISKQSAGVLYFDKTVLADVNDEIDIYKMVKEGKWIFNEFAALASAAYKDDDGRYGINYSSTAGMLSYFGIKEAGVDKDTGDWKITLNAPNIKDIINSLDMAYKSDWWIKPAWGSSQNLIADKGVLFIAHVLKDADIIAYDNLGVVPYPMYNEAQGRYYVSCGSQLNVLMCIPKSTQDREMSDYFLDVLFWTGKDYIMKAYLEEKAEIFKSSEDLEMIKDCIIPNITYDAGAAVGWVSLLGNVKSSANVSVDEFEQEYALAEPKALETIAEWNKAWGSYTEN